MSLPVTLSPKLSRELPLPKRKRRETVDLTGDDDVAALRTAGDPASSSRPIDRPTANEPERRIDDDELSDDEDKSIFEDALDEIELNPFRPLSEDEALSDNEATMLQAELRQIGIDSFIRKHLSSQKYPPRLLGTAFGIDPNLIQDDAMYLRILGLAIARAFHKRQKLVQFNTIGDAADLLKRSRSIMVITGAGISTSLGIPDFRSKGTGFYEKLRDMGFNEPEEVFDIHNFDEDPQVFYSLAGDILPDLKRFTPTHAFIKLLQDNGRLQTNYTQNIDNLEELAGIEKSKLIQCHGSFATASCRKCKYKVRGETIFENIRQKRVARCKRCLAAIAKQPVPVKKRKSSKPRKNEWDESDSDTAYEIPEAGVMKPDITFFGEQLPDQFFDRFTEEDSKTTDLVIVIGTSLKVAPVSEMPNYLPHNVPHIYISREPVTHINFDIQLLGDCDTVVFELCRQAGWDLKHEMIPEGFKVKVRPFEEDSKHMWRVKPRKPQESSVLRTPQTPRDSPVTTPHRSINTPIRGASGVTTYQQVLALAMANGGPGENKSRDTSVVPP